MHRHQQQGQVDEMQGLCLDVMINQSNESKVDGSSGLSKKVLRREYKQSDEFYDEGNTLRISSAKVITLLDDDSDSKYVVL